MYNLPFIIKFSQKKKEKKKNKPLVIKKKDKLDYLKIFFLNHEIYLKKFSIVILIFF